MIQDQSRSRILHPGCFLDIGTCLVDGLSVHGPSVCPSVHLSICPSFRQTDSLHRAAGRRLWCGDTGWHLAQIQDSSVTGQPAHDRQRGHLTPRSRPAAGPSDTRSRTAAGHLTPRSRTAAGHLTPCSRPAAGPSDTLLTADSGAIWHPVRGRQRGHLTPCSQPTAGPSDTLLTAGSGAIWHPAHGRQRGHLTPCSQSSTCHSIHCTVCSRVNAVPCCWAGAIIVPSKPGTLNSVLDTATNFWKSSRPPPGLQIASACCRDLLVDCCVHSPQIMPAKGI